MSSHSDYLAGFQDAWNARYAPSYEYALKFARRAPAPEPDPATLGPDEPHPGGTPHAEWAEYVSRWHDHWVEAERKRQAEARKHFDVV